MSDRPKISPEIQADVLLKSARRCCLCFGLRSDAQIKKGQIAHIDQNSGNNELSNLVYLCFDHHDEFDSSTSQSKGLTKAEVIAYRERLAKYVQSELPVDEASRDFVVVSIREQESILDVISRYWKISATSPSTLSSEIKLRMRKVREYQRLVEKQMKREYSGLSEVEKDRNFDFNEKRFKEALDLPDGIWGLSADGYISSDLMRLFARLVGGWTRGTLSYWECHRLYWLLDEDLDFDQYYILYGLPLETLSALGVIALDSFIYEFGMRKYERLE